MNIGVCLVLQNGDFNENISCGLTELIPLRNRLQKSSPLVFFVSFDRIILLLFLKRKPKESNYKSSSLMLPFLLLLLSDFPDVTSPPRPTTDLTNLIAVIFLLHDLSLTAENIWAFSWHARFESERGEMLGVWPSTGFQKSRPSLEEVACGCYHWGACTFDNEVNLMKLPLFRRSQSYIFRAITQLNFIFCFLNFNYCYDNTLKEYHNLYYKVKNKFVFEFWKS